MCVWKRAGDCVRTRGREQQRERQRERERENERESKREKDREKKNGRERKREREREREKEREKEGETCSLTKTRAPVESFKFKILRSASIFFIRGVGTTYYISNR